jgi:hypothetical protein
MQISPTPQATARMQRPAVLVDDRVSLDTAGLVLVAPLLKRVVDGRVYFLLRNLC